MGNVFITSKCDAGNSDDRKSAGPDYDPFPIRKEDGEKLARLPRCF